jgi:hypothetical protein
MFAGVLCWVLLKQANGLLMFGEEAARHICYHLKEIEEYDHVTGCSSAG